MSIVTRRSLGTVALTCALAFASPVSAQECTAELSPSEVDAGKAAVELSVTLSESVGAVHGLEAPPGSGISLASPSDVPRTRMARPDEARETIAMGESESSWAMWLNTANAQAGVYRVVLLGSEGQCVGEVTVN